MRILTVVHNHSSQHPGGTELLAEALHRHYAAQPDTQAWLLAGCYPALSEGLPGTTISALPGHDDTFLFRSNGFDPVSQSHNDPEQLFYDLVWLLDELKPDAIHIHHLNHFGVEFLALLRRQCPNARIVMTLHDYYLMCTHDGQLQDREGRPCKAYVEPEAAPLEGSALCACDADMPLALRQARRQLILKHLAYADRLVSPSRFLRDRFVGWGVPRKQLQVIAHGWPPTEMLAGRQTSKTAKTDTGSRPDTRRFGLFGNLRATKGTLLAIEAFSAAARLSQQPLELDIWGEALYATEDFKEQLRTLIRAAPAGSIRQHGRYTPADLPRAMAATAWVLVPSTWWENAPLVIQEAFASGRPVLCSNIGGMAEAVRHDRDGLHVPAGDVSAWRDVMLDAGGHDRLWQRLHDGIAPRRTIADMANDYLGLLRTD